MRRQAVFGAIAIGVFVAGACSDDASAPAGSTTDAGIGIESGSISHPVVPTGATLTISRPSVWVPAGKEVAVPFTLARNAVAGPLLVHLRALPDGVTAADVAIAPEATGGSIVLAAADGAVLGATSLASATLTAQTQEEDTRSLLVRVSGPSGEPDTTWADLGTFQAPLPFAATVQSVRGYRADAGDSAGKIVFAGTLQVSKTDVRLFVARLTTDGHFDSSFGDLDADAGARAGYTILNPGPNDPLLPTTLAAVAIDGVGRIAFADTRGCNVEVSRLGTDGVADALFPRFSANLNGVYCGRAVDVATTSTNDVVVLANYNRGASSTPPAPDGTIESIVQLFHGTDGARDGTGFHLMLETTGERTTRMGGLAIDGAGRFVLAGQRCAGGWSSNVFDCQSAVVRLMSAGTLDPDFAGGFFDFGMTNPTNPEKLLHTAFAANGDVLAAGFSEGVVQGTLARLGASGQPSTFGTGGKITRDLLSGASAQLIERPFLDTSGRIVFAGSATKGADTYIVRGRTGDDGTLDPTYATNGIGITTGVSSDAWLGDDDRLVIAGSVPRGGGGSDVVVLRFWP